MAPDDIFHTFYGSSDLSREQFFAVWDEVATTLDLEPGKLRPTDRFGVELRGSWFVDNEVDVLTMRALARAKKQNRQLDPSTLQTVDDYVRFLCSA